MAWRFSAVVVQSGWQQRQECRPISHWLDDNRALDSGQQLKTPKLNPAYRTYSSGVMCGAR